MQKSVIDDLDWREINENEIEWYRLWFEFLKLSDKKKWSNYVASVIDADYFKDTSCTFEGWWPSHRYLFRKLPHSTIDVITSVEDYLACKDDYDVDGDSLSDFPVTVALSVHMWAKKADLRAAFDEILKKYHKGKKGKPKFDELGYHFSLYTRPDTDMLKKTLAVYRAKNKPENAEMSNWQIEEEASREFLIIDKTQNLSLSTFKWNQPLSAVSQDIIDKRRNYQCSLVIRYLKCAEEILGNVVKGRFPVYPINPANESAAE